MRVFIKRKGIASRWEEPTDIEEISIDLEGGGRIDFFQSDSQTLRTTMTKGAKLNIETP